ncbi:class I SAM-dependent methyltransferase [Natronospira bacteriovora]|uniref:Class I SAM-dependent methyltransferase n=1 Tax=Natronospira bacteriovora TaxID=3069753 RepID=A0ABU0W7E5_9GAMM|nr:class I SAM-dependent methyltransferase [Natronospira sp. AB-CW4]MDQ2069688.1 class I SAM-dependent methyltransferase [Natronospira sp. AB-CW4]
MSSSCPLCQAPSIQRFCLDFRRGWGYWRCRHCRLSWRDAAQRPTPTRERQEYEQHQNDPEDPGYQRFLSRLSEPLLARLPEPAEGLDYGAGPGPAMPGLLASGGHRLALYDPFFHPDPTVLQGQYDFIVCSETAEHFHHPRQEFDRLHGLLRPGGLLALMTGRLDEDARFARWRYRHDPTHVCFYRQETLEWIGDHYGYERVYDEGDVTLSVKT